MVEGKKKEDSDREGRGLGETKEGEGHLDGDSSQLDGSSPTPSGALSRPAETQGLRVHCEPTFHRAAWAMLMFMKV